MSGQRVEGEGPGHAALEEALEEGAKTAPAEEVEAADQRIQELLDHVAPSERAPEAAPDETTDDELSFDEVKLLTATPVALQSRLATVEAGGKRQRVALAEGVAADVIRDAIQASQRVLLERVGDAPPKIVGVIQTAPLATLRGGKVAIEASEELLLRSGRAAIRLRPDGDVELVGSRISAMSRGLFRLVGRVLRLN